MIILSAKLKKILICYLSLFMASESQQLFMRHTLASITLLFLKLPVILQDPGEGTRDEAQNGVK